ncbi:MAG: CpaF family protein [Lachnospiraceae bacterium]|nr:CpaF family protein [Lachnospiraceae bacterium]
MDRSTKRELASEIMERADMYRDCSEDELKELIDEAVTRRGHREYISLEDKRKLKRAVFNSLRRLDVLQDLVEDEEITEIMVNGPDHIVVEKEGRIARADLCFEPPDKLSDIVQQIASGSNRIVNESSPIVDARLTDGSRVNIVLPPVSLSGPIVTIRKFKKDVISMERLTQIGAVSAEAADFLRSLVLSGYNIFISGGTGSGKTTFLNALSGFIPKDERIITIEDSAELQIKGIPNLVRMECRNANVEGNNEITIRDLIKTALRMRPTRLIVGEVRDGACIDMLQALNTGHSGMSTGHANSPTDCISRLETMVLLGAEIPLMAVRKQIASAVELIIHLGRLRDGSRRVLEICEVRGQKDGEIELAKLFEFREEGGADSGEALEDRKVRGKLVATGETLRRTGKLIAAGIEAKSA